MEHEFIIRDCNTKSILPNINDMTIEVLNNPIFIVSHYLGLKDKKGNKIFNHDVIKIGKDVYAVVIYMDGCACYNRYGEIMELHTIEGMYEKVGNIFDNPEIYYGYIPHKSPEFRYEIYRGYSDNKVDSSAWSTIKIKDLDSPRYRVLDCSNLTDSKSNLLYEGDFIQVEDKIYLVHFQGGFWWAERENDNLYELHHYAGKSEKVLISPDK